MGWVAPAVLIVFCLAYAVVFLEERLNLRKSKPVMVAAGLIWILVAAGFGIESRGPEVTEHIEHVVLEYAELFLFLLSAISFINALVERRLFDALRSRLTAAKVSVRGIFWLTGLSTCRPSLPYSLSWHRWSVRISRPLAGNPADRHWLYRGEAVLSA